MDDVKETTEQSELSETELEKVGGGIANVSLEAGALGTGPSLPNSVTRPVES